MLHFSNSIVAQGIGFVNLACIGIARLSIISCVSLGWFGCNALLAQEDEPASDLYRQALDKLGSESRIEWLESGALSLKRWEPGRSIELRGVLVEWEPTRLVLVRKDAKGPTTFPGDQVIGIDPGWKEKSFADVHRHFMEHRFAEVISEGQSILKTPSVPRWQQRLIVAEMVQSACALGQWQVAGKVYGYLAQDTSPQVLLSVIPLPWSDELLSAGKGMREPAAEWLQRTEPEMQLLGASWLLGSEQNGVALDVLKRLSSHESPLVSHYAQSQLWRSVPPSEVESTYFGKWVALRDAMPLSLQSGPTMLLGHRLEQSGAWELAVAEWLRIASLYGDRYHLKTQAIERAIAACRAAGAVGQADRIAARFPPSPLKTSMKNNR
jgi:hypothetical protein